MKEYISGMARDEALIRKNGLLETAQFRNLAA